MLTSGVALRTYSRNGSLLGVPRMEACGQLGVLVLDGVFPDHPPSLTLAVRRPGMVAVGLK